MCGIAGVVDLAGRRAVPAGAIQAMAEALVHRGPDEDGYLEQPGLALASRRLSIVGLADGRQPITNETADVSVVYNGELFDYPEQRAALEKQGHRFRTHCDTELIPHLWEDHAEGMFAHLRGQFALALWDQRRRRLILARDRFGICPLYWTRQGDWLLFASEIKALLASGMVPARPDLDGINHVFTFFALPGPATCFAGVRLLLPGRYLDIQPSRSDSEPVRVREQTYWELDFPDRGTEDPGANENAVVDGFEAVLTRAVERRLRADVPVVSYLSGGVDSGMVVALATHVRGRPIPTFTIQITDPRLDETGPARRVAHRIGVELVVVRCGVAEVLDTYSELIQAAEAPVIDTSCAALLLLAREVHARGYKVALTGEGADEWLAGYPWYKLQRLLRFVDFIPGLPLSELLRRGYLRLTGAPRFPWSFARRNEQSLAGPNAWLNLYGLVALSKLRFFNRPTFEAIADRNPYADLQLNLERMRRFHPLHRGLYLGARVMLPGLLLQAKGDRVAMNSSIETRYPFLDEDVFALTARLHPRWKLRGLCDKYLLRKLARRRLPADVARRPKAIFRAPFDVFHAEHLPPFVDQLLSEDSLRRTGWFDPQAVAFWRQAFPRLRRGSMQRMSVEMGLAGVMATQLWTHTFIDDSLADLPSRVGARRAALALW
jgi:asparagine synthase (glutamine-hydrolysing)